MRQWVRSHLTYATVVATLALFVALGGGTALASYVISSNKQVGPGTISGHKPASGDHPNVIAGSINGKDIADRSGVDTCQKPLVKKFGPICAGSPGGTGKTWQDAVDYCAGLGLRLPSVSEAVALANNFAVPGVSVGDEFWTDELLGTASDLHVLAVEDTGNNSNLVSTPSNVVDKKTVCVTDPSA